MNSLIERSLKQVEQDMLNFCRSTEINAQILQAGQALIQVLQNKGKILSCGNGGSMCDAMHLSEELSGRFRSDRKALASICLSDSSFLTCAANDYGFDKVFSRGVEALGQPEDALVVFSTSGSSPNIVEALKSAKENKIATIALLGRLPENIEPLVDHKIVTPGSSGFADRVQEQHGIVIHLLIELIEHALCPST